jgi:hypothetical protein
VAVVAIENIRVFMYPLNIMLFSRNRLRITQMDDAQQDFAR